ncbi:hypothetical protein [Spongiactinospora sp. 9N601]|uniref:hypothetical protein n=1 Tax=Spongiactinospora sp. 9N601 TaxID=3375149 RepID=UPI0037B35839
MTTVIADPRFPKARFTEPSPSGFLYLGIEASPLGRGPFPGKSPRREQEIARLSGLAARLEEHPDVRTITLYRAVLAPPIPGRPGSDLAMLIETTSPDHIAGVREAEPYRQIGAALEMPARNVRKIGETDPGRRGSTFLFNHFTGPDPETAVAVWETLTGWFTGNTGIDNSTALTPLDDGPFAVVNFVRLPTGPRRFLLRQFTKRSFGSFVRARLREYGMTSMPIFHIPV